MSDDLDDSGERTLRDLLITEGNSDKVARNLLERMRKEPPQRKERWAYTHFLINAGYYKDLLAYYGEWFKEKNRIPLMAFCHLLHRSGFRPRAEFLQQLFLAIDETAEPKFVFAPWTEVDPRFKVLHQKAFENTMLNAENFHKQLMSKLQYFRVNRMIDEEARLLDEMLEMFPQDRALKDDQEGFKVRWADALIARKSLESIDASFMAAKTPANKAADTQVALVIMKAFQEAAAKHPKLAYNLALGLYFLDLYEPALAILAKIPASPANSSVVWFRIECLLQGRRYVECLEAVGKVEEDYADDPETTFGATYYRAQALNGLGQIGVASELLKSIIAIRPSYRAAHSLLLKWSGPRSPGGFGRGIA